LGAFAATRHTFSVPQTAKLRTIVASKQETIELPVRSAVLKQCTGGLVVRWVTTSEYPLLYVFAILLDVTKGEEGRWRDESGSFWWLDKRARSK
jgi:hypothetical protein